VQAHSLATTMPSLFSALCICALMITARGQPWRTADIADPEAACQAIAGRTPRTFADGNTEDIAANAESVVWGFFWKNAKPYRVANSGDEMLIETVTHHGTDAYDEIVRGDPGMESIYKWDSEGMTLNVRGATGRSDGAHIMTGPVWICGAEKDDVLQIDLIEMEPRRNPRTGKSFGVNAATWWGFHRRTGNGNMGVDRDGGGDGGYMTGDNPRETVTIYEALLDEGKDAAGNYMITPRYGYQWWTDPEEGEVAQQADTRGIGGDWERTYSAPGGVDQTTGQDSTEWNGASRTLCIPNDEVFFEARTGRPNTTIPANPDRTYGKGQKYPCVGGYQSWNEMGFRGMNHWNLIETETSRVPKKTNYYIPEIAGGDGTTNGQSAFKMPGKIHPGNIGVARDVEDPTDSIPPGVWGGNMDNRRLTQGTSLFVPVQVEGALFSVGDVHFSQGDSEMDGTAIEASVNVKLRFTLHKNNSLPAIVQNLDTPLIETPESFIIQGATMMDYHSYPFEAGKGAFSAGRGGGGDLNAALATTYRATIKWMMRVFGWSEDLALSAITVGVDFGISQVVDGTWGIHGIIPKMFFPVVGFPKGPRDRTGENARKPGMTSIARVSFTDHGLTEDDITAGEESLAFRNFVTKVVSDMKDSISSCSGDKKSSCGIAIEVLSVKMGGSRRSLLDNHVVATTTVSGLSKSDLDAALSNLSGFEETLEPDTVADGNGASAMVSQQVVFSVLASLAIFLVAWA